MTLDDLKAYKVQERDAVCGTYRTYRICGMGPPSSGQVAVQQILGILETQDMAALKPGPDAVHWIAEAGRLAYADRALFLADPAFVNVPVKGLTDPGYLKSRAGSGRSEQVHGQGQARRSAVPEDLPVGRRPTASSSARATSRSSTATAMRCR